MMKCPNKSRVLSRAQSRGFTLIEVAVAMAIVVTVSAIGLSVYAQTTTMAAEARVRAQMDRDANVVLGALQHDLAYYGVAVPPGTNPNFAGPTANRLFPVMRLGLDRNMAFLGDAPFPNSEFTGVATVVDMESGMSSPGHHVLVVSDVSGSCPPPKNSPAAAANCKTTVATAIPATYVSPADDCSQGNTNARTCPWGMNKWFTPAQGELFWTISDPGGNWFERTNEGAGIGTIAVSNGWGVHFRHVTPQQVTLNGKFGGTFLSVLDRTFYAVESAPGTVCTPTAAGTAGNCKVSRRQCWGSSAPTFSNLANFPSQGATVFIGTNATPTTCGTLAAGSAAEGTAWETLATGVKDLQFRYFDSTGVALATPLSAADKVLVRAIESEVTMERKLPGTTRTVTTSVRRRFFLPGREQQ